MNEHQTLSKEATNNSSIDNSNPAAYSEDIQSPACSYSNRSIVCNSRPAIIPAFMSSPCVLELSQFYFTYTVDSWYLELCYLEFCETRIRFQRVVTPQGLIWEIRKLAFNEFIVTYRLKGLIIFSDEKQRQLDFYKRRGLPLPNGDGKFIFLTNAV